MDEIILIKACYSSNYYAQTHTNSMEKLREVAHAVVASNLATLIEPVALDLKVLRQLHNPQYVDAFLAGIKPLAEMSRLKWSPQLKQAVLAINAGQLEAANIALREGVAANIAQGFHHAHYDYGGSYCTFNGLALVAQQYPEKKIFVLDCDQHGGDGTAEYTQRLPNLFNFTIYGHRYGSREYNRSIGRFIHPQTGCFEQYQQALQDAFLAILSFQPDLIIYQAGVDCHLDDPYGSRWLDANMLYQRDNMVFKFSKKQQIPILFVLAGGYQPLPSLIPLHVSTFQAAKNSFKSEK